MYIDTRGVIDGVSHNQNNAVTGTAGDDVIIAGHATQQTVTVTLPKGGVQIRTVSDNDVIEGGAGDDVMTGGYGNDVFVFNFAVTSQTQSFDFRVDGDLPNQRANVHAWDNAYAEWVAKLEALGTVIWGDADGWSLPVNWQNQTNMFTQEFAAADVTADVLLAAALVGDGHDTITDFGNGHDKLRLAGLSDDPTAANYWANLLDVSYDGADTVISWSGGSITLQGVDLTGSLGSYLEF